MFPPQDYDKLAILNASAQRFELNHALRQRNVPLESADANDQFVQMLVQVDVLAGDEGQAKPELIVAIHFAKPVRGLVIEALRRIAASEQSFGERAQAVSAQDLVLKQRHFPDLDRSEELFDGLNPTLLGLAPSCKEAI